MNRLFVICLLVWSARAADPLVYVGTYTDSGSQGIYAFRLQSKTGKLAPLGLAAATSNPSFLLRSADHRFLYAVNENGNARQMGSVSAYSLAGATGKLKLLNWVSSRGGAPCHLAFDRTARWLAVANYEGGSVSVLPVHQDGTLGDAVYFARTGSYAGSVAFSPDNRFLLASDPGADRIYLYRFDASTGALVIHNPAVAVKPGSGVRQLAFHPGGKVLYAVNQLSSTVTVFDFDSEAGRLKERQTLTTLPGFSPDNQAAALLLNSDASQLYVSNCGHDSIYTFTIDPRQLTLASQEDFPTLGRTPRHFAIDPAGQYLIAANQDTNNLVVLKVHARTGQLAVVGKLTEGIAKPACVLFVQP